LTPALYPVSIRLKVRRIVTDATVRVQQRGSITLPASLRERYNIKPGDTLRIVDLDGVLVLTPMVPMIPELAADVERARIEAGLSVEEMLAGLQEERERYFREKYAEALNAFNFRSRP
jgi:AbrB family looped-hinge helix DNA binding protein